MSKRSGNNHVDVEEGTLRRTRASWPSFGLLDRLDWFGLLPSGLREPGESPPHRLAGVALFLGTSALTGGFLWPYVFNSWLVRLGAAPSWGFWQGAALGAVPFIGQTAFLAAIVTWLFMLF